MRRRSHIHLGSRAGCPRRRALFTLAATAGLLGLIGGNVTMAAASGSSTSPIVKAGVKAIGRSSKPNTSGLLSLHSSQATGVVEPKPVVYLVFWGSQWLSSGDPKGAANALQGLFSGLYGSGDSWGAILDQYCQNAPVGTTNCNLVSGATFVNPTSSVLFGPKNVWFDKAAAAPSKASASQIALEAVNAANHFGNTTPASNLNAQYVIASPSGTHPDNFPHGFCAWHSSTASGSDGNIAYTNLPYVPDLGATACTTLPNPAPLFGYESTETHEFAESVTDPFPSSGWLKGGSEIGDLCVSSDGIEMFSGVQYDVQGLWSNKDAACVTTSS